jgi:hypothetical protein
VSKTVKMKRLLNDKKKIKSKGVIVKKTPFLLIILNI